MPNNQGFLPAIITKKFSIFPDGLHLDGNMTAVDIHLMMSEFIHPLSLLVNREAR